MLQNMAAGKISLAVRSLEFFGRPKQVCSKMYRVIGMVASIIYFPLA